MSKLLAVMIAGLFAAGAYAQGTSPATTSNPPTDTKPQVRAQGKVDAKPAGLAKESPMPTTQEAKPPTDTRGQARSQTKVDAKPAGLVKETPMPKSAEGGAIGTDKAAMVGERRAESRDTRRTNKDGTVKRKTKQGGTPD